MGAKSKQAQQKQESKRNWCSWQKTDAVAIKMHKEQQQQQEKQEQQEKQAEKEQEKEQEEKRRRGEENVKWILKIHAAKSERNNHNFC